MSGVVLGLQGTVDFELEWDGARWSALAHEFAISTADLDRPALLTGEREIAVALLARLRDGRGGESHAIDSALIERFARRFSVRTTLGGTCVRAALMMRVLGVPALLHLVSTDDTVRRLLPPDCEAITSATEDTLDPHLIMQFPAGATVQLIDAAVTAPHPNRFIVANDPPARELRLSTQLASRVAAADVFMMSGFNSIQEPETLSLRLAEAAAIAAASAPSAVVMFEDAGYHRPDFAAQVGRAIAPVVDVYSMNEEELEQRLDRAVDLTNADDVLSALGRLRADDPHPVYVVHTKYWAVAYGDDAGRYAEALEGGIAAASARYLHGDAVTAAAVAAAAELPAHPVGEAVVDAVVRVGGSRAVGIAARRLETAAPTTIGLGDTFVGGFVAVLAARAGER